MVKRIPAKRSRRVGESRTKRRSAAPASGRLPNHGNGQIVRADLPDELLALARMPVSGTYVGLMEHPTAGKYELELRVDIDQSFKNAPVLNRASWDVSQLFTSGNATWRVYRGSWSLESPTVHWGDSEVEISGVAQSLLSSAHASTIVRIPWTDTTMGPARVTLTEGADSSQYRCQWKSNHFREVELRIDVCKSVDKPPLLPDYDTHSHADRPSDLSQRRLTIEQCYAEAGIKVSIESTHRVIDDSDPSFESWTPAELHDAMVTHYEELRDQPQWKLWGLMAGEFQSPGVGGIMFDAASQYGGAGQAPERQGFALFRKHKWFDHLTAAQPTTQAQAWAARHFLYTWVHEAGHAFNHLHSWDKARPDALSWMNYDWRYDQRNGTDKFWKEFTFRFDDEELLHLRHGARSAVIMGGDSWGSGTHLEMNDASLAQLELTGGSPPVEVLLRSDQLFQFMEPVWIELRLRNLTKSSLAVEGNLQPEFGVVSLLIKGPDGIVKQYEPLMCKLAERRSLALKAAGKVQTGADRHSETIELTFGKDGFYFDRPGQYAIRAIYEGMDGTIIPSNLHRIRVGHPFNEESERVAQDFFTHDVGLALYLNGSQSPRLEKAMSTLREVTLRFPQQPMAAKTAIKIASAVAKPFFAIKGAKLTCLHKAQPLEAISLTDNALAFYAQSTSRSVNLPHRRLVEQRGATLESMDEHKKAEEERKTLVATLKQRGVNSSVLKSIEAAT